MRTPIIALVAISFLFIGCEPEVKLVSMDPKTINLSAHTQSTKIDAKAETLRGEEIPGITLTFSSSNTGVAEVSSEGLVTPVGNGSAVITATTPTGKNAQSFVKVCMPQEIVCDPPVILNLRVGTASPLKCHLLDCNEEKTGGTVSYTEESKEAIFKDGENTFVGKVVGKSAITVAGGGLEKKISVVIGEQIFAPGMGPGSGGGGGGGGGYVDEEKRRNKDPYDQDNKGGQFNHILKNMK